MRPNCISIDSTINPTWARKSFNNIPIQGGFNPKSLLKSKSEITREAIKYLKTFKNYNYIFNLGHGVLPSTNPDKILIDKSGKIAETFSSMTSPSSNKFIKKIESLI